jgi:hypothetical protein
VGADETFLEVVGSILGNLMQRYARGVGRDDGGLFGRLLDALHQLALGFAFLDYGLDDPVSFADPLEVVLEVAGPDPVSHLTGHERGRPRLAHPLEAGLYDSVVVVIIGGYVEQVHLQPRVGAVGGDGRAHRAGPEYGNLPDPVRHKTFRSYP